MGADAVLLIAAALDDEELRRCAGPADELGLTALVEVHDEVELDRALAAGSRVVGVNQRDLRTFKVDHERACAMAARIPADVVAVAESGIRDGDDARRLAEAGYDAIWSARRWCGRGIGRPAARAGRAPGRGREMSEDLLVKICGITSEADALLAVSLGASSVGFIFAPSPRQVSVQLAGDIAKRLPEHVLTVGVFRDEAPQRVVEAVRVAGLGRRSCTGTRRPRRRSGSEPGCRW